MHYKIQVQKPKR